MTVLPAASDPRRAPQLGLIVLQTDETIEMDFRRLAPPECELLVSRVPSGDEVTPESLAEMEAHLTGAAALFPPWARFAAVGYGCTSGTAQIGAHEVARRVRAGTDADHVTEPVSALVAACRALDVSRLALVSPYVEPVSARLIGTLDAQGIATAGFGSFDVPQEAKVVRIDAASIAAAAETVAAKAPQAEAVFLSCTNLRALDVIGGIEARLGLPVLSSNQVLAWHMAALAGVSPPADAPGRLFAHDRA